eukprot:TRINITY_DN8687_c0_g1_i1.p1 TRINITY_DN8687_c0_g1~~TRINITY_DN8687_c0_g1_i1.p1  ORF type:complete len:490 (-),score=156.45 TRINITY_DN8687_c0_g1_i1:19-1488(-)
MDFFASLCTQIMNKVKEDHLAELDVNEQCLGAGRPLWYRKTNFEELKKFLCEMDDSLRFKENNSKNDAVTKSQSLIPYPTKFKVVMLGTSGSGKSSIISTVVKKASVDFNHKATISLYETRLPVDTRSCHLQLWDTSAKEHFIAQSAYYSKVRGAVVVMDIKDLKLDADQVEIQLESWLKRLYEFSKNEPVEVPVIIALNKAEEDDDSLNPMNLFPRLRSMYPVLSVVKTSMDDASSIYALFRQLTTVMLYYDESIEKVPAKIPETDPEILNLQKTFAQNLQLEDQVEKEVEEEDVTFVRELTEQEKILMLKIVMLYVITQSNRGYLDSELDELRALSHITLEDCQLIRKIEEFGLAKYCTITIEKEDAEYSPTKFTPRLSSVIEEMLASIDTDKFDISKFAYASFEDEEAAKANFGSVPDEADEIPYLVIYMVGGITDGEIRTVHHWSKQIRREILLASNALLTPLSYLTELRLQVKQSASRPASRNK